MPKYPDRIAEEYGEVQLATQLVLDLSTAHMPCASPEWGDLRVVGHEHGFIVFVPGEGWEDLAPEWTRPVVNLAIRHDMLLISFDSDGETLDILPKWEW